MPSAWDLQRPLALPPYRLPRLVPFVVLYFGAGPCCVLAETAQALTASITAGIQAPSVTALASAPNFFPPWHTGWHVVGLTHLCGFCLEHAFALPIPAAASSLGVLAASRRPLGPSLQLGANLC